MRILDIICERTAYSARMVVHMADMMLYIVTILKADNLNEKFQMP